MNKLAPRAELVTFIGYTDGTKGFKFIRKPNNVIYHATTALFDEYVFPFCPDMKSPGHTRIGANYPHEFNIPSEDGDDDGGAAPPLPPIGRLPTQAPAAPGPGPHGPSSSGPASQGPPGGPTGSGPSRGPFGFNPPAHRPLQPSVFPPPRYDDTDNDDVLYGPPPPVTPPGKGTAVKSPPFISKHKRQTSKDLQSPADFVGPRRVLRLSR